MNSLAIDSSSAESVRKSFYRIAKMLFNDIQIQVNRNYYRLLDIEFYYFAPGVFEDVYAHRHPEQLNVGKWYFHGSGIDITIGNGIDCYGGILIRGIALLSGEETLEKNFVKKEIHGPLNVKTELCSGLFGVHSEEKNTFRLSDASEAKLPVVMPIPKQIIETIRIGLSETKDNSPKKEFYNDRTRFVIFPHLKLKNKSRIAIDMELQFPDLSKADINKLLGSTFLK